MPVIENIKDYLPPFEKEIYLAQSNYASSYIPIYMCEDSDKSIKIAETLLKRISYDDQSLIISLRGAAAEFYEKYRIQKLLEQR